MVVDWAIFYILFRTRIMTGYITQENKVHFKNLILFGVGIRLVLFFFLLDFGDNLYSNTKKIITEFLSPRFFKMMILIVIPLVFSIVDQLTLNLEPEEVMSQTKLEDYFFNEIKGAMMKKIDREEGEEPELDTLINDSEDSSMVKTES